MRVFCPFVALMLFAGCVWKLDEERIRTGHVVEDCVVPRPAQLASWHAPVSVEYPDRSLWIWEEVIANDGTPLRNVGAFVSSSEGACSGDLEFVVDAEGTLLPLVSLTDEEELENATRTDDRWVRLSITGGFVYEGRAHLYYEKVLAGPGFFDAHVLGMGLCVIGTTGWECERVTPGVYADEPTLMWAHGSRVWNRGAFIAPDGYAYLWGCLHAGAFEDLCSVARVRPTEAADPSAYRFAGWGGSWIDDPWNAEVLCENAGWITPDFNSYLDSYIVVTANIWESTIELRHSDEAAGDYRDAIHMFDAVPPDDWFIGGGIAHAALSSESGRTIAVSYYTDVSGPDDGLHLVTFRFDEEL